ncbi:MAG: hypothetical protein WD737_06010 [Gemmatimonadota bacterium]
MISFTRGLTIAAATLVATACASSNPSGMATADGPQPPAEAKTTIEVSNHNWSDMVVYAVRHGTRMRLGMVTSMNSKRFPVPRHLNTGAGSVELHAEAIGSAEAFRTGPINVNPGQRVELKLENQLSISNWSVW